MLYCRFYFHFNKSNRFKDAAHNHGYVENDT